MIIAVLTGRYDCLQYLVDQGAEVNKADIYGNTAVILAVRECSYDCCLQYLNNKEHGADIHKVAKYSNTAVIIAFSEGRHDVLQYLVEQGVDIQKADKDGNTVVMLAVRYGHNNDCLHAVSCGARSRCK